MGDVPMENVMDEMMEGWKGKEIYWKKIGDIRRFENQKQKQVKA